MRISFLLVEQFIWKSGSVCSSGPFRYHKGSQIDKQSCLFAWRDHGALCHSGLCKITFQLLMSQVIIYPLTWLAWPHALLMATQVHKQECWQILPGEKGRNCGVPTSMTKKDARAEAAQCTLLSVSHPCIQPGLAKPHLWPHLASCLLTLSWPALNKVHNSTTVSTFGMSHTVFKRALNIKCIHSLRFGKFEGKSTSFKISWWCFYLHAVGWRLHAGLWGSEWREDGWKYLHSLSCHPQFAESSNISVVFQHAAHKCNVPSLQ